MDDRDARRADHARAVGVAIRNDAQRAEFAMSYRAYAARVQSVAMTDARLTPVATA